MAWAPTSPAVVPAALRALEPRGGLDKSAPLTGEAPLAGYFAGHPGHSDINMKLAIIVSHLLLVIILCFVAFYIDPMFHTIFTARAFSDFERAGCLNEDAFRSFAREHRLPEDRDYPHPAVYWLIGKNPAGGGPAVTIVLILVNMFVLLSINKAVGRHRSEQSPSGDSLKASPEE